MIMLMLLCFSGLFMAASAFSISATMILQQRSYVATTTNNYVMVIPTLLNTNNDAARGHDGVASSSILVSAAASYGKDETYFDFLANAWEKARRPPFLKIPRPRIERQFAVLLMRSSYTEADEMNFMAMDAFQKDFFLFRQSEWEDYKEKHPGISQGDLMNPDYFDFISFAQYATIARGMRAAKMIFEERYNAEGDTRTVQRPAGLEDNSMLPDVHSRRVGDRILDYVLETFQKPDVRVAPPGQSVDFPFLTGGITELLDLFRLNFFIVAVQVTSDKAARTISVKASAPSNFWSQQVLALREDLPVNDFEAKAVSAYLRACDVPHSYTTKYQALDVIHTFTVFT